MIMLGLGPTTFVWNQQVGPSCVGLTNDGYQDATWRVITWVFVEGNASWWCKICPFRKSMIKGTRVGNRLAGFLLFLSDSLFYHPTSMCYF
jgi:hypothetical protein